MVGRPSKSRPATFRTRRRPLDTTQHHASPREIRRPARAGEYAGQERGVGARPVQRHRRRRDLEALATEGALDSQNRPRRSSRARARSPARACAPCLPRCRGRRSRRWGSGSASSRVNSPEPHPTSSTRVARATTGATAGLELRRRQQSRVVGLERLAVRGVVARRHGGPVALLRGQMSAHEYCASTHHVLHRCDAWRLRFVGLRHSTG